MATKLNPKDAPHLPPKTCSIKARENLSVIKTILFIFVFSVLSSITTAIIVVDEYIPYDNSYQMFFPGGGSRPKLVDVSGELNPEILRDFRQEIIKIYDKEKIVLKDVYPDGSEVGQAVVLSSNGWSAMYFSGDDEEESPGKMINRLIGIDYLGRVLKPVNFIYDEFSGLSFVKFDVDNLNIVLLSRADELQYGKIFWSVDYSWNKILISSKEYVSKPPFNPFTLYIKHKVNPEVGGGELVMNENGSLIGFIDDNGFVIPAWRVDYLLPSILDKGKIEDVNYNWEGFFVNGQNSGGEWINSFGFYITKVEVDKSGGVKVGDIIREVNGEVVDKGKMYSQLLSKTSETKLLLSRDGVEMEIVLK